MTSATVGARRAPRRDAEENRTALLDAATTALGSDPDASLEAIAAAAGLSRRAVYGHFANRDDLVAASVARGAVRLADATADIERDDARVALALLGARLWDAVEQVRVLASLAVRGPSLAVVGEALAPVRARLHVDRDGRCGIRNPPRRHPRRLRSAASSSRLPSPC